MLFEQDPTYNSARQTHKCLYNQPGHKLLGFEPAPFINRTSSDEPLLATLFIFLQQDHCRYPMEKQYVRR